MNKDAYHGEKNLTLNTLQDLKGRSTVSKQYILDATNRPDIRQAERDVIRETLKDYGDTIPVKEFAGKVATQLLPLKRNVGGGRYEGVTLPEELRGSVANYSDHVYSSPIKTSAGDVHFAQDYAPVHGADQATAGAKNYFAHTRVEDMADGNKSAYPPEWLAGMRRNLADPNLHPSLREKLEKAVEEKTGETRRVIELQSDLFQKGNLAKEANDISYLGGNMGDAMSALKQSTQAVKNREAEMAKLEPYRNTWHERIIKEEIKQAAKDGKTKVQFPTGETAMKIEGLDAPTESWKIVGKQGTNPQGRPYHLYLGVDGEPVVGQHIQNTATRQDWIITNVLGDGKFKAVMKSDPYEIAGAGGYDAWLKQQIERGRAESFDLNGKTDATNPIYRFYEKEVGRYLKNKYNAERVTDDKGVTWWQVPVDKKMAKLPITAFGKTNTAALVGGTAASALVLKGLGSFGAQKQNQ